MLKALRDEIRLTIDIAGMRGSFTKAELIEQFYDRHRDRLFGPADEREMHLTYLSKCFTDGMKERVDGEVIERLRVPRDYMHLLDKLPRTLCICPSGRHVLSIRATAEDWAANSNLKREIGEKVIAAANVSKDMSRFLRESGRESLIDFTREAT